MMINPSDNLRRGRRNLEGISGLSIIDDLQWDHLSKSFYLHVCIEVEDSSPFIPSKTEWYISIDPAYPYGDIEVYPSVQNGITCTFPHQSNNHSLAKNNLWRMGKICLSFNSISLGIHAFDKEPSSVDDRLLWYVERAALWVRSAAKNELTAAGDVFELPDFSPTDSELFAFSEDPVSFIQWQDSDKNCGYASIRRIRNSVGTPLSYVSSFLSNDEEKIYWPSWGSYFSDRAEEPETLALWIRLNEPLCINNWQAPMTFEELQEACSRQGVDFFEILRAHAYRFRDGQSHFVIFGFPIPRRIGEEPEEITWQAIRLPILSFKNRTNPRFQSGKKACSSGVPLGVPHGFRPGEIGWWQNDKQAVLKKSAPLLWIKSENWNKRSIIARGQLSNSLCKNRVAVIGAGSLGSMVSELLIRGGVNCLSCVDGDTLSMGNLCRHTLTLQDIERPKSEVLAEHLKSINPHARIMAYKSFYSFSSSGFSSSDLKKYDIVIDTTGIDQVLAMLSQAASKKKVIMSASVGLGAKRVYICLFKKANPNTSAFLDLISPYLFLDRKDCSAKMSDLPRDGLGCWHPLFPASASDMWLAASISQKALESFIDDSDHLSLVLVYEAQYRGSIFSGYTPAEVVYDVV